MTRLTIVRKLAKLGRGMGCLSAVAGPLLAVILYPRANWLFAFVLVGIAIIVLNGLLAKDPNPVDIADHAERLLNGTAQGWDVDHYEHLNPRSSALKELWQRSLDVGGLPEEWLRLDELRKAQLRQVIAELRKLRRNS